MGPWAREGPAGQGAVGRPRPQLHPGSPPGPDGAPSQAKIACGPRERPGRSVVLDAAALLLRGRPPWGSARTVGRSPASRSPAGNPSHPQEFSASRLAGVGHMAIYAHLQLRPATTPQRNTDAQAGWGGGAGTAGRPPASYHAQSALCSRSGWRATPEAHSTKPRVTPSDQPQETWLTSGGATLGPSAGQVGVGSDDAVEHYAAIRRNNSDYTLALINRECKGKFAKQATEHYANEPFVWI